MAVQQPWDGEIADNSKADEIVEILEVDAEQDKEAELLWNRSILKSSIFRLPALIGTFLLELIPAFVLATYSNVLEKLPLAVAFTPILAALGGNVGLQSSSIHVRWIATGHISLKVRDLFKIVYWEIARVIIIAIVMGAVLFSGSTIISLTPIADKNSYRDVGLRLGTIVGLSQAIVILIGGFVGSAVPLFIKKCTPLDPALYASPFVTAFQDLVGYLILMSISDQFMPWILS
eukprot:TRINITY_DN746_c0_g1_i2.p1 TRINITY_DN746_c0_g1~~TRINITY_DN746_c0_g1_i2.p1  ORF type:complete len:233 (+),score=20.80 TRINITY_DN746_c0_g1_i2:19-717(+)